MALAIRLARGGRRNRPFYRIVVADKRMPRDGRYIEKLGTYNPLLNDNDENRVNLVKDRIEYWLKQGAKPSERVAIFLGKAGLIDMPKQPNRPKKSEPSEKTKMKLADKEEKRKAAEDAAQEAAKEAEEATKTDDAEAEQSEAPAEEAAAEASADDAPAEDKTEDDKPAE